MAKLQNFRAGTLVRTNLVGNLALWQVSMETASTTTAFDGLDPAGRVTMAVVSAGHQTLTFDGSVKPAAIHWANCEVREADANMLPRISAYDASTGAVSVRMYQNSAGTIAVADTNNKTLNFLFLVDTGSFAS